MESFGPNAFYSDEENRERQEQYFAHLLEIARPKLAEFLKNSSVESVDELGMKLIRVLAFSAINFQPDGKSQIDRNERLDNILPAVQQLMGIFGHDFRSSSDSRTSVSEDLERELKNRG